MAMREKVLEAAAALVPEDVPETLVNQEMERRLHDLVHRLEEQGRMTIPQYLAATGQDQQEFVDGVRGRRRPRRCAPTSRLRAVIAQEEIAATDEEVDAEIDRLAEQMGEKPAKVRQDLERRGVHRGGTL